MSRSEFRWNKKRKHYSYLFKDNGQKRMNFLLHTKGFLEIKRKNGKIKQINFIPLTKRPDGKDGPTIYIEPKIYLDETFSDKKYPWNFDVNDKRKIKRLKKQKKRH